MFNVMGGVAGASAMSHCDGRGVRGVSHVYCDGRGCSGVSHVSL